MATISIRELGRNPGQVIDEVVRTGRPAIITRHGRPVTALVAVDPNELEDGTCSPMHQRSRDHDAPRMRTCGRVERATRRRSSRTWRATESRAWPGVVLSRQAERDLRQLDRGVALRRIRAALLALASEERDLDVKPLVGAEPWLRLRVGDYRALYRPIGADEIDDRSGRWLVARIVHRRDLQRAASTLT